MIAVTPRATLGQIVTQRPSRSRVFEKLGLDYCCGGRKTLAQACAERGLDSERVVGLILAEDACGERAGPDPASLGMDDLTRHIEQTHHAYLKRELPRLTEMARKVAQVHGDKDARLLELAETLGAFRDELETHMMKEERVLFPMIRTLDHATVRPTLHCGRIENPIEVMEADHDQAGAALGRMRRLTDNYTPPAYACNTWRALFDGLAQLERDMHAHVHAENNILFPRAIARQAMLPES